MENLALVRTSKPHSRPSEPQNKSALIRLWIGKLALNAGQALSPVDLGVMEALWIEGFDDLSSEVLEAAFKKTLRESIYWPVKVADIRKHVSHAEDTAARQAGEQAWQRVLDIRRKCWNPDIPEPFERAIANLPERIRQAARAAGVFRDHESVEKLHVWTKKTFIDLFLAWGEAKRDEYLLPDGEVKNLLTDFAERKALPAAEAYEQMRARGIAYSGKLKVSPAETPDIKRALRVITGELSPRPPLRSIDEQKRILRERGLIPA